jgi:glycopeptide antibiotics resistance protein
METVFHELRYPISVLERALIVIAVVWMVVAILRSQRMDTREAIKISVAEALLVASVAAIWCFTILQVGIPMAGDVQAPLMPNWVPLIPLIEGLTSQEVDITAFDVAGNICLFIPLGAALVWRFHFDVKRTLAIALVGSIAIEAFQYTSGLGRSVDVDDVLLNGLGAVIGALSMSWVLASRRRSRNT